MSDTLRVPLKHVSEKERIPGSQSFEHRLPVLVFSKERETRLLFKTLLEVWGYRVTEADDLEQSFFAAGSERPSLVLIDAELPFDENLTIMRQLRENEALSGTPIILISGYAQPKFRHLALSLGADDYLVKPLDFDLLESSPQKNLRKDTRSNSPAGRIL